MIVDPIEGQKDLMQKAQLLSNSEGLLRFATTALGRRAGTVDSEARRVGYDYTATTKRIRLCKGKVFAQRCSRRKCRLRRVTRPKNKKTSPSESILCGGDFWPGLLYGVEL